MAIFGQKKERKPNKYYLWIFIGIVILGLGFYIYQKYTPPMPDDPNVALDQVVSAMNRADSASIEFEHRLGNDLDNPALLIAGTAETDFPDNYIGEIEIAGADPVLEQSPVPEQFEFAYLDGVYYQKDSSDAPWRDYSEVPDHTPFLRIEPVSWLTFCKENASVVREKDEEIDGQNYYVLSFSFPEDKTPEVIKPLALMVSDIPEEAQVSLKAWIDPNTKLVFQTESEVVLPDVGGERKLVRYLEYNSLMPLSLGDEVIKEEPPTEAEISAEEDRGEMRERNEKRQIDMLAIQAALEKAYDDDNVYPESAEILDLSKPDTEVYEVLSRYLKEVPVDPLSPDYYYGYYCTGGEQYELTAIQETEKEPQVIMLTQSSIEFEEKN